MTLEELKAQEPDLVSQIALLQSFPPGHPRFLCHHAAQGVHAEAGLSVVDFSDGTLAGVHSLD